MENKYKLLNGNWLSDLVQKDIKEQVLNLQKKTGKLPGLGVILAGNNPASRSYVKRKSQVAEEKCGFLTKDIFLPEDVTHQDLSKAIQNFNQDVEIHGILLQLPLPAHLNSNNFIDQINPQKDADGLHPFNQGLMLRGDGRLLPCTPLGCLSLIDLALSQYNSEDDIQYSDIPKADLSGKTAVIIGRSILVGKPLHSLLLQRNASVIQVHSCTKDIEKISSAADILIAAAGVPKMVSASWVKDNAIVIDVGINRTEEGKLVGDVDFNDVADKCFAITPVPKGVGPMTVSMLMQNTLTAFKQQIL